MTSSRRAADQFLKGAMGRGWKRQGGEDLRLDRAFRRLWVQQVSQHGVRAGRFSDGISQVSLPSGVHGRRAFLGNGRCRARQVFDRARRGLPPAGDRGAQAEYQRGTISISGSPPRQSIQFGLGAIKGVGFKAVEAIVKARERNGAFRAWTTSSSASRRRKWERDASRR